MISGVTDYSVRVASVQTLSDADAHGPLVFDDGVRVRCAAGGLVYSVWGDTREKKPTDTDRPGGLESSCAVSRPWNIVDTTM